MCIKFFHLASLGIGLLVGPSAFCQTGLWSWIKGDTLYDVLASPGVQGIPSSTNNPQGLTACHTWQGRDGMLWLWGGRRKTPTGVGVNIFADLWRFDPATNQWTWMKGVGVNNDGGSISAVGIENLTNRPPVALPACTWTDTTGNLWLYGGYGVNNYAHGLWRYNVARNMWSKRPSGSEVDEPNYGVRGQESASTHPGSVVAAVSWTTPDGMLYLFGGMGWGVATAQNTQGFRNSLWRYNPRTEKWAWLKGKDNWGLGADRTAPAVNGTLGFADTTNTPPGSETGQVGWTDRQGNLWMLAHDMWKYSPSSNCWTRITKDTLVNKQAFDYCYLARFGQPRYAFGLGNGGLGRTATWTDSAGRFWLFQGNGYRKINLAGADTIGTVNGLWCFDPALRRWSFVSGNRYLDKRPLHGRRGIAGTNVDPGDRGAPSVWYNRPTNSIYLFGGDFDTTTVTSSRVTTYPTLNDLLHFRIDPACPSVRFQPQAAFRFAFDTVCAGALLPTESQAHYADSVYYLGQGLRYDSAEGGAVLTQTGLISVRQVACNLNGCDTSSPQRVFVLPGTLSVQISPLSHSAFCYPGDTLGLRATASSISQLQWYRADTLFAATPSIAIADTGAWVVIASNSCAGASDTVRVYTDHTPRPDLGLDTLLCLNTQRLLDAGPGYASYRWSDGSSGQTLLVTAAGSYSVTTTSLAGCERADTIRLTADPCGVAVRKRRDTQLYPAPNPAKGILRLLGWQAGNKGILLDLTGKNIQTLSDQGEADVAPFSSGLYLWEVKTREGLVFRGRWAKE
ncbi:kelch repeat-containing protein [Nostoc sp. NIES-2111]